jgi:sec-independent protein translocase protein TatA
MGISLPQLLIILLIIIVLFGTKKLRNIGSDLGGAIKNFRNSMRESEKEETLADEQQSPPQVTQNESGRVIEGQVTDKQTNKV